MTSEALPQLGLKVLAGIFVLVSAVCLLAPKLLLEGMEIGLSTPTAMAEARAGYGGAFAGLAVLFWLGATRPQQRSVALGIAALVLGIFTLARVLSLLLDGTPNTLAFINHGLEALGFVLAYALWRVDQRRDNQRRQKGGEQNATTGV